MGKKHMHLYSNLMNATCTHKAYAIIMHPYRMQKHMPSGVCYGYVCYIVHMLLILYFTVPLKHPAGVEHMFATATAQWTRAIHCNAATTWQLGLSFRLDARACDTSQFCVYYITFAVFVRKRCEIFACGNKHLNMPFLSLATAAEGAW